MLEKLPAADQPWPELEEKPLPIFPVELLPGGCGKLCRDLAAAIAVPVDYVACAMLGAASAALTGRVVVEPWPGFREPVQLYLALCGKTGTRKTAALSALIAPLQKWLYQQNEDVRRENRVRADRRDAIENQLTARKRKGGDGIEGLRRELEDWQPLPEYEKVYTDTTPEALAVSMAQCSGRAIVYTDEGQLVNVLSGVSYGRQGGAANLDVILQGYDNKPCLIRRVQGGETEIPCASLTMTLGLQPTMWQRLATPELRERGMAGRMLYFVPDTGIHYDFLSLPPYPSLTEWIALCCTLAALAREAPLSLPLTAEASAALRSYQQANHERTFTDLAGDEINHWAQKAHGKAARLSGILTLLENPQARMVEAGAVRAAIVMMDGYFLPHAQAIFGGPDILTPDARIVLDVVKHLETFRYSEIQHKLSGRKRFKGQEGKQAFVWCLGELLHVGYIRQVAVERKQGRPPSQVYAVHPALRKRDTAKPAREGVL